MTAAKEVLEHIRQQELQKAMASIKPCPFCGESKFVVAQKILTRERWYVHCGNCKCRTFQFLGPQEAIEAWNRRGEG